MHVFFTHGPDANKLRDYDLEKNDEHAEKFCQKGLDRAHGKVCQGARQILAKTLDV